MKYYHSEDYPEDYIFSPGDLIVTMTDLSKTGDTLGYSAIVPNHDISSIKYLHNQRVGKVILKDIIYKNYIYYLMRTREYQWYILGSSSGTSVRHTSPTKIGEYKVRIPSKKLIKKFDYITTGYLNKILLNQSQIKTLKNLRDTLLPKLMSGEVRVKMSET